MYYSLSFVCSFKRRLSQCPFAGTSKRAPTLHQHCRHSISKHGVFQIVQSKKIIIIFLGPFEHTFENTQWRKVRLQRNDPHCANFKTGCRNKNLKETADTAPLLPLDLDSIYAQCEKQKSTDLIQCMAMVLERSVTAIIDCQWPDYRPILARSCKDIMHKHTKYPNI